MTNVIGSLGIVWLKVVRLRSIPAGAETGGLPVGNDNTHTLKTGHYSLRLSFPAAMMAFMVVLRQ